MLTSLQMFNSVKTLSLQQASSSYHSSVVKVPPAHPGRGRQKTDACSLSSCRHRFRLPDGPFAVCCLDRPGLFGPCGSRFACEPLFYRISLVCQGFCSNCFSPFSLLSPLRSAKASLTTEPRFYWPLPPLSRDCLTKGNFFLLGGVMTVIRACSARYCRTSTSKNKMVFVLK